MSSTDEYEGYNSERVYVDWWIYGGFVGAERRDTWVFEPGELPDDPKERDDLFDEMLNTEMSNYIEAGCRIRDEDE